MNLAFRTLTYGILISLGLGLVIILMWIFSLKTIPYEDQKVNTLGMLVVNEEKTNEKEKGITIYRFEDKKEQNIPGSWMYEFILPHQLFIFGFDPTRPGEQVIFTLDDRKAGLMNVSSLPGMIAGVKASSNRDYLAISGVNEKDKTYYTCVIHKKSKNYKNCRYILGDILTKDTYSENATYITLWNPAHDTELLIAEDGDKNRIFTYNPIDNKLEEVTDEAKKQEHIKTISEKAYGTETRQKIKKYGPLVSVTVPSTGKRYFFFHFLNTEYIPVSDIHLLYAKDGQTWLVDIQKKQKSEFVSLPAGVTNIHTFASQVR